MSDPTTDPAYSLASLQTALVNDVSISAAIASSAASQYSALSPAPTNALNAAAFAFAILVNLGAAASDAETVVNSLVASVPGETAIDMTSPGFLAAVTAAIAVVAPANSAAILAAIPSASAASKTVAPTLNSRLNDLVTAIADVANANCADVTALANLVSNVQTSQSALATEIATLSGQLSSAAGGGSVFVDEDLAALFVSQLSACVTSSVSKDGEAFPA